MTDQADNGQQQQTDSGQQQQNQGHGTLTIDDATIERIAAASHRQAAQQVQQGQQGQQQSSNNGAQSNNQGSSQTDILTAIQALPEQITRSIQEALKPPANSGASGNQSQGSTAEGSATGSKDADGNNGGEQQQPGRKKGWRGGLAWFE